MATAQPRSPRNRRAAPLLVAGVALALCSAAGAAAPADWPRWRGPGGDGIAPEKAPDPAAFAGGARKVWEARVGQGYSAVAIAGDRLFTSGNDGQNDTVWCFDPATGRELWTRRHPCEGGDYPGPRATPVVDGGTVFAVSRRGDVLALDAASGAVRWQKTLGRDFDAAGPHWGHSASPLVAGDLLLLNAGTAGLALDKATGRTAWRSGAGVGGYATPVAFAHGGATWVALFALKDLVVVDARTGREKGRHPWQTSYDVNAADPLPVGDGRLFISSGYGKGCALLDAGRAPFRVLWQNTEIRNQFGSSALLDGRIYGIDGNTGKGDLVCLDAGSGAVAWRQQVGFGSLIAAEKTLVVLTERGEVILAAADPAGYRELARAPVLQGGKAWTSPVLCRGLLYARSDRGQLVCVAAQP